MRLPAEWEPHERTLMGWPCRLELWGETIDQARADYATVANAIAEFEPVTMIANPGADAAQARAACGVRVEIAELPLDDSWLRDCGPIYVYDEEGHRLATHFRFNAWGEKFDVWDRDAGVGPLIGELLGDEVRSAPIVLEGGSILGDGAATLLTTEQCLLHPNRNPALSREEIASVLLEFLGAERVVWLGRGLVEDRDTDGHVDLIASFTEPGRVLLQTVVASYLNLYLCNGAVIVPVCGADTDSDALGLLGQAFPERQVVAVPGAVLAYGGGGPHCITQPVPLRHGRPAQAAHSVPAATITGSNSAA